MAFALKQHTKLFQDQDSEPPDYYYFAELRRVSKKSNNMGGRTILLTKYRLRHHAGLYGDKQKRRLYCR